MGDAIDSLEVELQCAEALVAEGARDVLVKLNSKLRVVRRLVTNAVEWLPHSALRDRKADKQECNEQILKLSVSLNQWIHGSSFHISFVRTSHSLAVTLRKEGQVEIRGEDA